MFVFENLIDIEDMAIQLILQEIETSALAIALKGATDELREKFFRNMSSRAADMLREDTEAQGPMRISRVEEEQKAIVEVARRLAESGQITLGGDRKSTRLNSSHVAISYAVFCLKKKKNQKKIARRRRRHPKAGMNCAGKIK